MKPGDFKKLLKWFKSYVSGFLAENPDVNDAVRLKEAHTYRVCGNITLLSRKLGLSPEESLLAKTMALFHDLGRFEQYRRYGTFNDRISQNHAELGVAELSRHGVLSACRRSEIDLITCAIAQHNAATLPQGEEDRMLFFMRLLRDADKLDIWNIVCDYYRRRRLQPEEAINKTIELDLPDRPACSPAVVAALYEGRYARMEDLRTLNDFKLLQISWAYDLNFQPSFRMLRKRGYIKQIAASLPAAEELIVPLKRTQAFIDSHVHG